jgi:hypothetical protein
MLKARHPSIWDALEVVMKGHRELAGFQFNMDASVFVFLAFMWSAVSICGSLLLLQFIFNIGHGHIMISSSVQSI